MRVSIKEASVIMQVHPDTVRRYITKHLKSLPGSPYVSKDKVRGYSIDRDWLLEQPIRGEGWSAKPKNTPGDTDAPDSEAEPKNDISDLQAVVTALNNQLEAKDKQIDQLNRLLDQQQQLTAQAQRLLGGGENSTASEAPEAPVSDQARPNTTKTRKTAQKAPDRPKNPKPKAKPKPKGRPKNKARKISPVPKPQPKKKRWWQR